MKYDVRANFIYRQNQLIEVVFAKMQIAQYNFNKFSDKF
jgi:hypothetical protein